MKGSPSGRVADTSAAPRKTDASSTANASAHSRRMTRVRRAGSTWRSTDTKIGMLPIGSTTSTRTTTAELKLLSMALPRLPRGDPRAREHDDRHAEQRPAVREVAEDEVPEHEDRDELGVDEGCEHRRRRVLERPDQDEVADAREDA